MTRIRPLLLLIAIALSACTIHHVTPYVPDAHNAPQTMDAADASTNCLEASTAAESATCASAALAAPNRAMVEALQSGLRGASLFGRDALLANQRAWLLGLQAQCKQLAPACLHDALAARATILRAWQAPYATAGSAIAQYVGLKPPAGAAAQPDPAFCAGFAKRAGATLLRTGTLDPAAMGFEEVAGTHGLPAAPPVSVDLYDANAFALFERRARSITIGSAPPVITPISLTQLVERLSGSNQGGRFSSFASQTGDYGQIDVFRDGPRLLALAADPWGSTTPASPGEAAHAGLWDITGPAPVAACLFDTYTRPAEPGVFDRLPNFAAWRDLLDQIRASADLALGNITRRDQTQLNADTVFTVLHMPLLAVQQASEGRQTLWLRHRHDEVLDALFAWSTQEPAHKALFDQLFALLRPAAADLVHAYQTTQGLDAKEATQAAGIAIMELLYQSTLTISPALGASLELPSGVTPRYPILASPQ